MEAIIFSSNLVKNNKGCGDFLGPRISTTFLSVEEAFEDMKLSCEHYLINIYMNLLTTKKKFSKNYKFKIYKILINYPEECIAEINMNDVINNLVNGNYDEWFRKFNRYNKNYMKAYDELLNK